MTNGADAAIVSDALHHVLTGSRLTAVRYADLDYGTATPYWHEGDHDSLGQGIELDFADGSTWSIIWEQNGFLSGLGVWRGPLIPDHLVEAQVWDVTQRWKRRGPRTITNVQAFWLPERPEWEGVPGGPFCLAGVVLHDDARDRQAIIAIDHRDDVTVYFAPEKALRDGYFTENYVSFGTTNRSRTVRS